MTEPSHVTKGNVLAELLTPQELADEVVNLIKKNGELVELRDGYRQAMVAWDQERQRYRKALDLIAGTNGTECASPRETARVALEAK